MTKIGSLSQSKIICLNPPFFKTNFTNVTNDHLFVLMYTVYKKTKKN